MEQNTEQNNEQVNVKDAVEGAMTKTVDALIAFAKEAEAATQAFTATLRKTAIEFVTDHMNKDADSPEEPRVERLESALSAVLTGCALEASRAIAVLANGNEEARAKMVEHFTGILDVETKEVMQQVIAAATAAETNNSETTQTETPQTEAA